MLIQTIDLPRSGYGYKVPTLTAYVQNNVEAHVDHDVHVFHHGRHGLSLATPEAAKDQEGVVPHVARWFDLALEWLEEDPE